MHGLDTYHTYNSKDSGNAVTLLLRKLSLYDLYEAFVEQIKNKRIS